MAVELQISEALLQNQDGDSSVLITRLAAVLALSCIAAGIASWQLGRLYKQNPIEEYITPTGPDVFDFNPQIELQQNLPY